MIGKRPFVYIPIANPNYVYLFPILKFYSNSYDGISLH